jgi:phosphohistidine swiveling domain-containing protein
MSSKPHMNRVIPLRSVTRADVALVGGKAATLGELLSAGFEVPDGFIVVGEPTAEALAAGATLGGCLAARSSAVAEDLAGASFAGQYETVLDVRGADALEAAIRHCRASAEAVRVALYRSERGVAADTTISVLVQRMVAAEAAGVAFTANPISGDRSEVVITAGRGLGERIVGGDAVGDEWRVRDGGRVERSWAPEQAIDAAQARQLAKLCRRIEQTLGGPQDIEWALSGGRFYVLQARPMTALPSPVEWTPPTGGRWSRNFRIGEWLPEAMTPLFADWLLERIEHGFLVQMKKTGAAMAFRYAAINGWYYTAPPRFLPLAFLRAAVESRGRLFKIMYHGTIRVGSRPEVSDRRLLRGLAEQWQNDALPHYRRVVAEGERAVETASREELARLIDEVGALAGEQLMSLSMVGGSAWKMEGGLARFLKRHAADLGSGTSHALLTGLPGMEDATTVESHAVQTLDWYQPTAGEIEGHRPDGGAAERRQRLVTARERATAECRAALRGNAARLARFESFLEVTQRYSVLREQQSRTLTLAWPLLRRCVLRLGAAAATANVIEDPEDAFFLRKDELLGNADAREIAAEWRTRWEQQRRLVAPLHVGKAMITLDKMIDRLVESVRSVHRGPNAAVVGHPASPGRATGAVRIVLGPDDFATFMEGEVLVAKGTAPAWTPLFARAAAIVTDGGSLAAHASLVAREYGIPAVVGTGDATARLRNGQVVTVDGSAGVVELEGESR